MNIINDQQENYELKSDTLTLLMKNTYYNKDNDNDLKEEVKDWLTEFVSQEGDDLNIVDKTGDPVTLENNQHGTRLNPDYSGNIKLKPKDILLTRHFAELKHNMRGNRFLISMHREVSSHFLYFLFERSDWENKWQIKRLDFVLELVIDSFFDFDLYSLNFNKVCVLNNNVKTKSNLKETPEEVKDYLRSVKFDLQATTFYIHTKNGIFRIYFVLCGEDKLVRVEYQCTAEKELKKIKKLKSNIERIYLTNVNEVLDTQKNDLSKDLLDIFETTKTLILFPQKHQLLETEKRILDWDEKEMQVPWFWLETESKNWEELLTRKTLVWFFWIVHQTVMNACSEPDNLFSWLKQPTSSLTIKKSILLSQFKISTKYKPKQEFYGFLTKSLIDILCIHDFTKNKVYLTVKSDGLVNFLRKEKIRYYSVINVIQKIKVEQKKVVFLINPKSFKLLLSGKNAPLKLPLNEYSTITTEFRLVLALFFKSIQTIVLTNDSTTKMKEKLNLLFPNMSIFKGLVSLKELSNNRLQVSFLIQSHLSRPIRTEIIDCISFNVTNLLSLNTGSKLTCLWRCEALGIENEFNLSEVSDISNFCLSKYDTWCSNNWKKHNVEFQIII